MEVAAIALVASIALVFVMLVRQRSRTRPEGHEPGSDLSIPRGKRERIMAKLEPLPEIPTVMDLVREEVAETGVDKIPGHEGLAGPVMLKVFKRDHEVVAQCTHDAYAFVIADDVSPEDADESHVRLLCAQCLDGDGAGESKEPVAEEPAEAAD